MHTYGFKGSLLLGGVSQAVLGADALSKAEVFIHPFAIVGWCGLISTAFNCLPVGSLDGGRLMQSMYGRKALSLSSLLSYIGLGFGLLGSTLALPFGLYVVICQRVPEQFVKDSVTRTDDRRALFGLLVILFAILTLIPMAPDAGVPGMEDVVSLSNSNLL